MPGTKTTPIALPEHILARAQAIAKANHWPLRSMLTRLVEAGIERIEREAAISLVLPPPPKFEIPVVLKEDEPQTKMPPALVLQRATAERVEPSKYEEELRRCFRDSELASAVQAGVLPPESH